jgi:hypothetical protein
LPELELDFLLILEDCILAGFDNDHSYDDNKDDDDDDDGER